MKIKCKEYRTIWFENNTVKIIDQTKLPHKFEIKDLKTDNNCCCPKDNLRADFFDKCSKLENFRISLTLSFLLLDI